VLTIASLLRVRGGFQRRADLLRYGYTDAGIRRALGNHEIFRVRHGWYALPDVREAAVRAVRVGGRLTGAAAMETYDLRVPRRSNLDVVVPRGACRLRSPDNRSVRLDPKDPINIHWTDAPRREIASGSWRVSLDDALVFILSTESRDIAIACCSAVARYKNWSDKRMDAVFARAPVHAQKWRTLVCALDDAHGETLARLWILDAGIPWESQPYVASVGWFDGRVSPNTYVEIDGAQHDPHWTGDSLSSYDRDHDRDTTVVMQGGQVLRYVYRQLYNDWPRVLAAIKRAREDDLELIARRERQATPPRVSKQKQWMPSPARQPAGSRRTAIPVS
jgi:hypothetical protein